MSDWSPPDADGIQELVERLSPRRRISGLRIRRAAADVTGPRIIWNKEALALLAEIVPAQPSSRHWSTIQGIAGAGRIELLRDVIHDLLRTGLIEVRDQKLRAGDWQPHQIDFIDIARLRQLAGLPDLVARAQDAQDARNYPGRTPPGSLLAESLSRMSDAVAVRRSALVRSFDAWIESGRSGTRYDFALSATGKTKGITKSDWEWLRSLGALEAGSIVDHEPMLMVAGRWTLHFHNGARIDVGAHPNPVAIAASSILAAHSIADVGEWVIVENRTVFDRAARLNASSAIIWTPGYSPTWWLRTVARILDLAPAPARIACDPDPAGIAIALRAAGPWVDRGLAWQPAGMSAADLESLTRRWPLSMADHRVLDIVRDSVPQTPLAGLHAALARIGKGEQEGFFDNIRLAALLHVDVV